MSNIVLQYGQCGNQIGQSLYEFLYDDIQGVKATKGLNSDYATEALHKWFTVKKDFLEPKSILIDTEDKVTALANKNKQIRYRNIVSNAYGGSANNWAFGYSSQSLHVLDETLDRLRKEIEKCDLIGSIINILSSSGGTGSGVGSRVIEAIREEYPTKFLINVVVLPYKTGDVVTQNYNTLLTLSKLYDITDGTILFENDKTHNTCKGLFSTKDLNLKDLNYLITQQLASVMQPVKQLSFSRLMSHVSAHPSYKFLQVTTAPHFNRDNINYEPKQTWSTLINQVTKNSRSNITVKNTLCKKIRYIGNILITRGTGSPTQRDIKKYIEPSSYVSWVPENEKFVHYPQERRFAYYENFISLLTNNNNICNSLNFILEDAWNLFVHSAYLHHYTKYGLTDEHFLESFQKLENILNDYKRL